MNADKPSDNATIVLVEEGGAEAKSNLNPGENDLKETKRDASCLDKPPINDKKASSDAKGPYKITDALKATSEPTSMPPSMALSEQAMLRKGLVEDLLVGSAHVIQARDESASSESTTGDDGMFSQDAVEVYRERVEAKNRATYETNCTDTEAPSPTTLVHQRDVRSWVGAFSVPGTAENLPPGGAEATGHISSSSDGEDVDNETAMAEEGRTRDELPDRSGGALVEATLVSGQSDHDEVVMAEAMKPRRQRWFVLLGMVLIAVAIVVSVVLATRSGESDDSSDDVESSLETPPKQPTLEKIQEEGVLRCGVTIDAIGDHFHDLDGLENYIDAAFCEAVAAAAMGKDSYQVDLVPMPFPERVDYISTGKVDLLVNFFSYTMDRDVLPTAAGVALNFAKPFYHLTSSFGGWSKFVDCAQQKQLDKDLCGDLSVCVLDGTRYWDMLALTLPKKQLLKKENMDAVVDSFLVDECNVMVAPWLEFSVLKRSLEENERPVDDFVVSGVFTFEPMAITTRDDDTQFSDFVRWVFEALLAAEQHGITKQNIQSASLTFHNSNFFGESTKNMLFDAVATVGNYGEIMDRLDSAILPPNPMNSLNNGTTGIIHSLPLGLVGLVGPSPDPDGTLSKVAQRGRLRCAVRLHQGFADMSIGNNSTTSTSDEWVGMDVDYCATISGAIFGSATQGEELEIVAVLGDEDGFEVLQSGDVDVYAGVMVTMERNILEPSTSKGFAFTRPYFYNMTAIFSDLSPSVSPEVDLNRCLATRKEDVQWSKFVMWLVEATFFAEENDITELRSNDMPIVSLFGPAYQRIFRDAILTSGHHGSIYERNVEPHIPRSGLNLLYDKNNPGPLQFPLPGLFE